MQAFILQRFVRTIGVLIAISIIVFSLVRFIPGDPMTTMLSRAGLADPEIVAKFRQEYGLDQPLYIQYVRWISHVLRGDLGRSLIFKEPIATLLKEKFRASLVLGILSVVLAVISGSLIGLGAMFARIRQHTLLGKGLALVPLLPLTIPDFCLGIIFIYIFAVNLRLLPAAGMYSPMPGGPADLVRHIVLPAVTLCGASAAYTARLVNSALLQIAGQDYIRTAYAKGLGRFVVLYRHVFRNALIPVVTNTGMMLASVLSGAVLIETVFAWPGMGKLMVDAILGRDYPLIQAASLLIATVYQITNLVVDISYVYIDPRIRYD